MTHTGKAIDWQVVYGNDRLYGKFELPQNNYALSQYYHGMLTLYDQFREHDPDCRLRKNYDEQLAHHIADMKRDRLLECKVNTTSATISLSGN